MTKELDRSENSLEGIYYSISVHGDVLEENKVLIGKVLLRLPKQVREKVIDEVIFFIVSKDLFGHYYPITFHFLKMKQIDSFKFEKKIGFIVLNFVAMKNRTEEGIMSTIAHEIAHHVLGHGSSTKRMVNDEEEADNLTEKWGFQRAYQ